MISASDTRMYAREHLRNKWGKAIAIIFGYLAIELVIFLISNLLGKNRAIDFLISLAEFIISVPIMYGFIISYIKLKRDEQVKAFDFLKIGFANFAKSWKITLWSIVKLLIPIILLILSYIVIGFGTAINQNINQVATNINLNNYEIFGAIIILLGFLLMVGSYVYMYIKGLGISMAINISYDGPNMLAKETVNKSEQLMKGNKGKLFILEISFIGWIILGIFTLGIGLLWVLPYMIVSTVCFYDNLVNKPNGYATKIKEEVKAELKEEIREQVKAEVKEEIKAELKSKEKDDAKTE